MGYVTRDGIAISFPHNDLRADLLCNAGKSLIKILVIDNGGEFLRSLRLGWQKRATKFLGMQGIQVRQRTLHASCLK
jgi:hypothetical protein